MARIIVHDTLWTCPDCGERNRTSSKENKGTCAKCEAIHDWWQIDKQPEYEAEYDKIVQEELL